MFGTFQRQIDSRSLEVSAMVQERIAQHEKICGERWEASRNSLEEVKDTLQGRVTQTQKLHAENQKELATIKRLIYIGLGIAMTIGAMNTDLGRRVAGLLGSDTIHNSVTVQTNPPSKER